MPYEIAELEFKKIDKFTWRAESVTGVFEVARHKDGKLNVWQYMSPQNKWWFTAASKKLCFEECQEHHRSRMLAGLREV
jgi:hypothetical protein